jgi:AmmeMemoRadiSam system protein A
MPRLFDTSSEKLSENPGEVSSRLPPPEFSFAQRKILLDIAHEAIVSHLEQRPALETQPLPPELLEPRGVFTTLYLPALRPSIEPQPDLKNRPQHVLRGCVGYAVAVAPLHLAVAETARAAAFEDARFVPVTRDEAPRLNVSLSVLSRLFPIHPDAVEIGRHGLMISNDGRRGLLLPQVPFEHGWDRETFLAQTCQKAGLPMDAWRKSATVEAFTAEVFGDAGVDDPR